MPNRSRGDAIGPLSRKDLTRRRAIAKSTTGHLRIEGLELGPEAAAMQSRWARGEVTGSEVREEIMERYGLEKPGSGENSTSDPGSAGGSGSSDDGLQ